MRATVDGDDLQELSFHFINVPLTFSLDQNFDTGFVQIVATTPAVVHTHDSFEVVHDLLPRQELTHQAANDGGSAHATAHPHFEADFALCVFDQLQADIVPANGSAVFACPGDGNFEFAGQECELGMQGAPLTQDLRVGSRVDHFVHGHAGQLIGGDVANAVAAGLNAMHVHSGQKVHHVGRFVQGNPVELNVLTRGEVAITFEEAR